MKIDTRMKSSQTNLLKNSNTGLFVLNFFHENLAFFVILWKILYARQATVRFACGITEVTNCPEYVTLKVFPLQLWLRERNALLRYT